MSELVKRSLVLVEVLSMKRSFYFLNTNEDIHLDDYVVIETLKGLELGKIKSNPIEKEVYEDKVYSEIVKKASLADIKAHENNEAKGPEIVEFAQKEADKEHLPMTILSAVYNLDQSKMVITYYSEERVDFRDLLKVLIAKYTTRIELKQVGSRDKAKLIGGLGICGLPLCCSTFLNEFDGISITMAKNQMLSLNIPKLSGHCGKLICCLKYENDAYTELQQCLPRIGSKVKYNDAIYKIASMNVITKNIRLENKDGAVNVPYDDIKDNILPSNYFENNNEQHVNVQNDDQNEEHKYSQHNDNHQHNNNNRNTYRHNRFKSSFEQKATPRINDKEHKDEKN